MLLTSSGVACLAEGPGVFGKEVTLIISIRYSCVLSLDVGPGWT